MAFTCLAVIVCSLAVPRVAGPTPLLPTAERSRVSTTAATPPGPRRRLLVWTDSVTPRFRPLMADVMTEVRSIWKAYLDLEFADGDSSLTGFDERLRLVVVDEGLPQSGSDGPVLGSTEFLAPDHPADRITVSVAAAHSLAARTKWGDVALDRLPANARRLFVTRALSRSIAHEIGHYVLRSTTHVGQGLMRPRFPAAELLDADLGSYRLSASEIGRLHSICGDESRSPGDERRLDGPALRPLS